MIPCLIGATFLTFGKKKKLPTLNSLPSENMSQKWRWNKDFFRARKWFHEVNPLEGACPFLSWGTVRCFPFLCMLYNAEMSTDILTFCPQDIFLGCVPDRRIAGSSASGSLVLFVLSRCLPRHLKSLHITTGIARFEFFFSNASGCSIHCVGLFACLCSCIIMCSYIDL